MGNNDEEEEIPVRRKCFNDACKREVGDLLYCSEVCQLSYEARLSSDNFGGAGDGCEGDNREDSGMGKIGSITSSEGDDNRALLEEFNLVRQGATTTLYACFGTFTV